MPPRQNGWRVAADVCRRAHYDDTPRRDPHALRVVALLTLGFWALVGMSCAAWVMA
jgi:hypothetical protein